MIRRVASIAGPAKSAPMPERWGCREPPIHGRQDKSADRGRAHVVGWIEVFANLRVSLLALSQQILNDFNGPSAVARIDAKAMQAMTTRDDDLRVRPGRIRHGNRGRQAPKTFVGEVMRAAKKAGHIGNSFRSSRGAERRSRFGRGRRAASRSVAAISPVGGSSSRRASCAIRARVPLGAAGQAHRLSQARRRDPRRRRRADVRCAIGRCRRASAFAERCEDDRHHFRFIVSPEDAGRDGGSAAPSPAS